MTCANCGTDNPAGAHFCGGCGTTLPQQATPPTVPPPAVPPAPPTLPQVPPVPPMPPSPPVAPPGADPTLVGGLPPVPPVPPDPTTTFAVPPPGAPPPGPVASPAEKGSKKSLLIGVVALLVVAGLVGAYLVTSGGDDDGGGGAREIVLEPITQTLADDFAGNLDFREFDDSLARVLPDVPPLGDGIASVLSARRTSGDEPGLYGGSQDVGTCDVSQLVDFLTDGDNEAKAEAWAEVQGIDVDEIEDFIADLTPVRLRFDTRVTNHGFDEEEGAAFEIQSVLESGTAVLVDDTGVPRVKCNCGNPLAEPEDVGDLDDDEALDAEALVQNLDDAWDDFDPEEIVVVEAADDALDEFILVDIETEELFKRPVGTDGEEDEVVDDLDELCEVFGDSPTCLEPPEETTTTTEPDEETTTTEQVDLGTGDVQVTLEWASTADLDLAVTDPTGETIDFTNSGPSVTGGQLDVDQGSPCGSDGDSGVENIFWPPGGAPAGAYVVEVNGFSVDTADCGGGAYTLTIRIAGQADQVIQDSVGNGETDSFDFTV
jgi:hypothetical protein